MRAALALGSFALLAVPATAQAPERVPFDAVAPAPVMVHSVRSWTHGPLPPPLLPIRDPGDPPDLGPPPPHHTRDAILITTGLSVVAFGTLLLLPEDITGWSVRDRSWDGVKDELSDFRRHVTNPPVWDTDSWVFNYVGHPYVGMNTYLMERNYGHTPLRSFLFSTAASVVFEYVVESWAEPPSLQDLLVTSPVGSVLGELNYRFTRHLRRHGLTLPEKAVLTLVNPLHVLQHGYR